MEGRPSDSIDPDFQGADEAIRDPNFAQKIPNIQPPPSHRQSERAPLSSPLCVSDGFQNREKLPTRGNGAINPQFQNPEPVLSTKTVPYQRSRSERPPYNCPCLWVFYLVLLVIEILLIVFIAIIYKLPESVKNNSELESKAETLGSETFFNALQMVFLLGLGMLHAYLKHHSWTSLTVEFFVGVFGIQLGLIFVYFWESVFSSSWGKRELTFVSLMKAEINSFTTMVSVQTLIGKLSIPQYFVLSILESICSSFNYALNLVCLKGIDDGGSLYIYCFGSFFALGACMVLYCCGEQEIIIHRWRKNHDGGNYYSSIIAVIGTSIVWVFMPSMNSALAPLTVEKNENLNTLNHFLSLNFKYRGIINSLFGLIGSAIGSFAGSTFFGLGKVKMDHVIFGSICGGVVVAASCCINTHIYASLLAGLIISILSLFLFWSIKPFLNDNGLFDTLGGGSIFGIPGFLGGILCSILIASGDEKIFEGILKLKNRTLSEQAGVEVACSFITLGFSIGMGAVVGIILRVLPLGTSSRFFVDSEHFEEEDEPLPEYYLPRKPVGYEKGKALKAIVEGN